MTNLASPKWPWVWGTVQDAAFAKLHEKLCNLPVLKLPNFKKLCMIDSNAYKDATDAVFLYKYDNGFHPITFCSSKYASVEHNYGRNKKKLLAVFKAYVK